jgi:hypothetical protein
VCIYTLTQAVCCKYVYVCICMYVYIHVCVCIYTYIYINHTHTCQLRHNIENSAACVHSRGTMTEQTDIHTHTYAYVCVLGIRAVKLHERLYVESVYVELNP